MTEDCCYVGLSCEPVDETLSVCVHGNPIKFGRCLLCFPLIGDDPIKELRNRIESLHEFKLRQCDENKQSIDKDKITSKRLIELEETIKNTPSISGESDYVYNIHNICSDIDDIKERLEKLTQLFNTQIEHNDAGIDGFKSIEERMNEIQNQFDIVRVLGISNDKKPFRCPVCDGRGHTLNNVIGYVSDCKSCNGKGIVWG